MKYINSILYLTAAELKELGIYEAFHSSQRRNSSDWVWIYDPSDARKVLIQYSTLRDRYKEMVIARFGDPYAYMASDIIQSQLSTPAADVEFLATYLLPDGTHLPYEKQKQYATAASYLQFLHTTRAPGFRALGFTSAEGFYQAIQRLIECNNVDLPRSYSKLRLKVRDYARVGVTCVISKGFCNKSAAKIKDEVAEALLIKMISHYNQFEDTFVAAKYNIFASATGRAPITDRTVGYFRHNNKILVTAPRQGMATFVNQYEPVKHRTRPSYPLALINSDDNDLDLYFREETITAKGTRKGNPYFRFKLVVVIDAFNDYPLGYAVGKTQTVDLVKAAYLNAVHHIKEITGEHLLWHQIQADHYALKALRPFYEGQAIFTPPRVKLARGKIIEQSFGHNWHSILRQYPNYANNNITAQKKGNFEAIQANAKYFPTVNEGFDQVADFFNRLRHSVNEKTGKSKQQQWLEAYAMMSSENKKSLTDQRRLLLFGHEHSYKNKLTNAGINVTLKGQKITYDINKEDYLKHVGKTMQVFYDPYDLTTVLATMDDLRVQVLCPVYEKHKMAVIEMVEGDRERLNVKIRESKEIGQYVLDKQFETNLILQRAGIDANSMLQAGVLNKEDKSLAENNYYAAELNSPPSFELDDYKMESEEEDVFDKIVKRKKGI